MSIEIYNGIKLKNVRSLEDTIKFCNKLKEKIKASCHQIAAEEIKSLACLIYDSYTCANFNLLDDQPNKEPIPLVASTLQLRNLDKNEPKENFEYSIAISSVDGITVAIPYFPHQKVLNKIIKQSNVLPYGFWTNSNRDDNVSIDEWEERCHVWSKILDSGIPAKDMLVMSLFNSHMLIPADKFMMNVPTVEDRLAVLLHDFSYRQARKELIPENNEVDSNCKKEIINRTANLKKELKPEFQKKINKNLTMLELEKPLF